MAGLQSSGHTGTWVSSSIHDVLAVMEFGLVQQSLNSWLGETPCPGIERLFLTPDDRLRIFVSVEVLLQLLPWEGVQLLNTGDGGVLEAIVGTVLVESGVHLTSAKNDSVNFIWLGDGLAMLGVGNDPFELRVAGKFFNWRASNWMSEQGFREEDD